MSCACTICIHNEFQFATILSDNDNYQSSIPTITFFIIGLGLSITWNSISFSMSYYTLTFSEYNLSWTLMLLAYNIPGLPIQLIQLFSRNDKLFLTIGSIICFLSLAITLPSIPFIFILISNNTTQFIITIILCFIIGLLQSCLFSFVFKLTSFFSKSSAPSCLGGLGFSTLLLLLITIIENFNGSTADNKDLIIYYCPLCIIPLISCIGVIYLYYYQKKQLNISNTSDDIELEQITEFIEENIDENINDNNEQKECIECCCNSEKTYCDCDISNDRIKKQRYIDIIRVIKYSCITSFIIGFDLVLLSSRVPNLNINNSGIFDATIMYLQSICLFLGNESAVFYRLSKQNYSLLIILFIQVLLIFPIMFHNFYIQYDDYNILLYIFVGIFAFLGSHINSCSYVLASNNSDKNPKAISILNICLYFGYLLAIIFNIIIEII